MSAEPPIGWIREVVLNCPDPWALASFWSGLLGGAPVEWYPGWVTLEPPPNGQRLSFQASTAPPADGVHFDILVQDLAAAQAVLAPGGRPPGNPPLPGGPNPPGPPLGGFTATRPVIRSAWSSVSRRRGRCGAERRKRRARGPAAGR